MGCSPFCRMGWPPCSSHHLRLTISCSVLIQRACSQVRFLPEMYGLCIRAIKYPDFRSLLSRNLVFCGSRWGSYPTNSWAPSLDDIRIYFFLEFVERKVTCDFSSKKLYIRCGTCRYFEFSLVRSWFDFVLSFCDKLFTRMWKMYLKKTKSQIWLFKASKVKYDRY